MQSRKYMVFLFLLVFPLFCYAQNKIRKELKGKLLSSSKENIFLETIYVYNKQSGRGILSDSLGNFKLALRQGDTLAISAMHIEPNELVIERMHLNDGFISLAVQLNTEYLEEVLLSNRSLTGDLNLDLILLPTTRVITTTELGFPASENKLTSGEQMLKSMKTSSSGVPIDLLFASLNGELKKVKKRITTEKEKALNERILSKIPTSFYTNSLYLKSEDIPHFIDFCQTKMSLKDLDALSIDAFSNFLRQNLEAYKEVFPERF